MITLMRIPVMIVTRAAFVDEGVCQPIIPREPFRQFEKEHFPTGNVATREIFLPLGGIFLLLISLVFKDLVFHEVVYREEFLNGVSAHDEGNVFVIRVRQRLYCPEFLPRRQLLSLKPS